MLTPNRVVVDKDGEAWSPKTAAAVANITPEIIFIRKDGWVLGAPKQFERLAYQMWANEWEYFQTSTDETPRPMSEYNA